MDHLDLLYVELVEALRRERPWALTDRFMVSELHEQLIPYRQVRNPAGLQSNGDYETALSRLLSGERGYVLSDAQEMQEQLRAGIEESLPDVRRFLAYPDVEVRLNPEEIPPPGHMRYAPPELQEEAARLERQAAVERAEQNSDLSTVGSAQSTEGGHGRRSEDFEDETQEESTSKPGVAQSAEIGRKLEQCPECKADLPERAINYCPHCGRRIARTICRECGEELEPVWNFCVECGTPRSSAR